MPRRKAGLDANAGYGAPRPDNTAAALVRRITSGSVGGSERTAQIALAGLIPAPWQPRRDYDAAEVESLAQSIRRDGLLQAFLVRPDPEAGGRYQVIFGHRRLRAMRLIAQQQGIDEEEYQVWAKVRECSDLEARILTSAENLHRKDLHAYEIALDVIGVQEALRVAGLPCTDRDLAHYFGRGSGTMAEYRVIGTNIDEALLQAAGFGGSAGSNDRIDWGLVGELTKAELYTAARPASEAARIARLQRAREKARSRAAGTDAARSPKVDGAMPRFTVEGLRSRGGFAVKLSRPFRSYSAAESRRYLGDLLPAVAALACNLIKDGDCATEHGADGGVARVARDTARRGAADELAARVRDLCGAIQELDGILGIAPARAQRATADRFDAAAPATAGPGRRRRSRPRSDQPPPEDQRRPKS